METQNHKYKLVRIDDNYTIYDNKISFIKFDKNDRGTSKQDNIEINTSLIVGPITYPHWQTSMIVEIIEDSENLIHFKTQNSEYKIYIQIDDTREPI